MLVTEPDTETQTRDLLSKLFLVTFSLKTFKSPDYFFALWFKTLFIYPDSYLSGEFFWRLIFLLKVCLSAIITERFDRFLMDCVKENINLRNEMRTGTSFHDYFWVWVFVQSTDSYFMKEKRAPTRPSVPIDIGTTSSSYGFFANWIWSSLNKFGGQRSALKN